MRCIKVQFISFRALRLWISKFMVREIKIAISSIWLLISTILLLILLYFYLFPDSALISLSANFQLQHHNQEPCPLCGMTRAFIAIVHGKLDQATTFNRWSVTLYGILLANGLLSTIFLINRIRNLFLSYRAVRKQ